jgi:(1->4)-alpha-D-glucan 1-alpha-D-glucosylmutase
VPTATYRLQFNKGFTFNDAQDLVSYLHRLGISDLYASPIFTARRSSPHGYDVTDPGSLNPELGTEQEFETLVSELKAHGMGLLLDIVPNHLAASTENPWWVDLLENGPASPYASFFDVDWTPPGGVVRNQIVLPILGKPYHEVLESGELVLNLDQMGLNVRYHDYRLPLEVKSYNLLFSLQREVFDDRLGAGHPASQRWERLIDSVEHLLPYYDTPPPDIPTRHQSTRLLKEELLDFSTTFKEAREILELGIAYFNGAPGEPHRFHLLHQLLSQQPYRLTFWQTGRERLNYRRFFDINDLVGVRVEEEEAFKATHSLARRLAREGKIAGLRLDHIDGLYDPAAYLNRLQHELLGQGQSTNLSFYLVVEKILSDDETLPPEWPVSGTTGYDFLNALNGVFVEHAGFQHLVGSYQRITGSAESFSDIGYNKKRQAIKELFGVEIAKLSQLIATLAQQDCYACDLPQQNLTRALIEIAAGMPVYRTYAQGRRVSQQDRKYIEEAVKGARDRCPWLENRSLDFVQRVLLGEWPDWLTPEQQDRWQHFVSRWQQFTGPAVAKGLEDTSLYIYNPLVSLNEVGGTPTEKRLSTNAFHHHNAHQQSRWPYTMNATSTHDTKRSEDVRARINVLSEIPDQWERCLNRWIRWNRPKKREVGGELLPDSTTEVLLYQTLIGAWPLSDREAPQFKERLKGYLIKATREAKTYTSWLSPNLDYEHCLVSFAESILEDSRKNRFLKDFLKFQKRVAYYGAFNSLSQVLLKIGSPGVPDFYQGTELWDLSLVDPDNRRPVEFEKRVALLDGMIEDKRKNAKVVSNLLSSGDDGRLKLYTIYKALDLRRERPDLFSKGEYIPLQADGNRTEHVCAFARRLVDNWALIAVPRLLVRLLPKGGPPLGTRVWRNDWLILPKDAPSVWLNLFTMDTLEAPPGVSQLPLASIFASFPVALLVGSPSKSSPTALSS